MSRPFRVVALGEVLWDLFPDGPRFGGAPANFACHAAALGAEAVIVSRVGDDELGRRALQALREHGVGTEFVGTSGEHPTGTVQVQLDAAGKATFRIAEGVAWDHLEWSAGLEALAAGADAVCFGTLGQRGEVSRRTIRRFVAATPASTLRILDLNLRPPFYDEEVVRESLALANVLKLSDEELPVLASVCGLSGPDAEVLGALAERFGLRLVALTRGPRGALLLRGDEISECPGLAVPVADTVGAGDAFAAALAVGMLRGLAPEAINRHACRVAAFVCSRPGGTPRLPDELRGLPDIS